MKLSAIHLNPQNPRFIRDEMFQKLVASLQKFPKMMKLRPIIIDENNIIQGGNMRYRALKKLGYKEIPDNWVKQGDDLTPEEWHEFVVKDNIGYGEWDMDLLSAQYNLEDLIDMGLEFPELFEKQEQEIREDHYEIPEKIETSIIPGDIFMIGRHRLMCGDATRAEDVLRLMDGKIADLVVTDPPYNVDYSGGERILNDKMSDTSFYDLLFESYKQMIANLKPGRSFYIFHSDTEGYNFRKALKDNGIVYKQCLIWVKNSLVMGRHDYHWRHEPILYGWKPGAAHYFINDRTQTMVIDDNVNLKKLSKDEMLRMLQDILSEKTPTTVIYHDRPQISDLHPTMKPVKLLGYLIQNSSRIGESVLDLFCGSGSTMIACHQLKRTCYAMDLDPVCCQVMIDRMLRFDPELNITMNGQPYRKNVPEEVLA